MIIKSAEELRAFYEEFARMFGANEEEKVIFAECFLRADLRLSLIHILQDTSSGPAWRSM